MASNDHVERRATALSVHSFALRLARQPSEIAYRRPPTAASWRSIQYRYCLVLAGQRPICCSVIPYEFSTSI
jgi:hypothetical protein